MKKWTIAMALTFVLIPLVVSAQTRPWPESPYQFGMQPGPSLAEQNWARQQWEQRQQMERQAEELERLRQQQRPNLFPDSYRQPCIFGSTLLGCQ